MKVIKLNRRKKMLIRKYCDKGQKKFTLVIMYDDLSKAKKPPAWMKELLFNNADEKAG